MQTKVFEITETRVAQWALQSHNTSLQSIDSLSCRPSIRHLRIYIYWVSMTMYNLSPLGIRKGVEKA